MADVIPTLEAVEAIRALIVQGGTYGTRQDWYDHSRTLLAALDALRDVLDDRDLTIEMLRQRAKEKKPHG